MTRVALNAPDYSYHCEHGLLQGGLNSPSIDTGSPFPSGQLMGIDVMHPARVPPHAAPAQDWYAPERPFLILLLR